MLQKALNTKTFKLASMALYTEMQYIWYSLTTIILG